jgi:hypothetical protein
MARRKMEQASGANLDSLMDTLTNVVGVLMIIMILVQINVAQAMKKIISELPPASPEEVQQLREQAQKQIEEQTKQKQEIEKILTEKKKHEEELKKLEPQLAALETSAQETKVPLLDVDAVRKKLEEQRVVLEKRKTEMAALLDEQQRLKAILDSTPIVAPPASKVVRIPNSRPIPDKAKIERYLISGGQLYYLDIEAAKKLILPDLRATGSRLEFGKEKAADGSRKTIYDQTKVAAHFTQRRLALRNLDVRVTTTKTSTRASVQLLPRPGQGENVEVAAQITSRFQNDLRRFKNSNTVVWLHVFKDSFEQYLRVRDICDTVGVAVGWDSVTTAAYAEGLPEFEVNRLEEPKPVDPNALRIEPPKKKLD